MLQLCPSQDGTLAGALDKGHSYDIAVMEVGKLTSRPLNPMSQHGAIKHVFEKTTVKMSRVTAEWSHRDGGLVPPSNRGRELILGQAGGDMMVKVVQLLIYHRLPRKKHIVLQIANNMADILGLDVGKDEQHGSEWFRDKHKDMFEFSAARDLESSFHVRLVVEGKFEGKKYVKQALLMPAVEEWWAEQQETREASQNNG